MDEESDFGTVSNLPRRLVPRNEVGPKEGQVSYC